MSLKSRTAILRSRSYIIQYRVPVIGTEAALSVSLSGNQPRWECQSSAGDEFVHHTSNLQSGRHGSRKHCPCSHSPWLVLYRALEARIHLWQSLFSLVRLALIRWLLCVSRLEKWAGLLTPNSVSLGRRRFRGDNSAVLVARFPFYTRRDDNSGALVAHYSLLQHRDDNSTAVFSWSCALFVLVPWVDLLTRREMKKGGVVSLYLVATCLTTVFV